MFYLGIFIVTIIIVFYVGLLFWLYIGIEKVPRFTTSNRVPTTSFTIVIALRNESDNLPNLLSSLSKLNYPYHLFEILFVDDASTDNSVLLLEEFRTSYSQITAKILSNERRTVSPKKDAITYAIQKSKNDWILTTDADCTLLENWLHAYDAFVVENSPVFIAGPVLYKKGKGFLHNFQELDWMSLVGTTIGSFGWNKPILCSGANMAYKKEMFLEVNGFEGNDHIASGDDVFLLQKTHKKYPNQVFFMDAHEAYVKTLALDTWKDVFHQRIRWAKKTSYLPNLLAKLLGICVFSMNLLFIILLVVGVLGLSSLWFFIAVLLIKFLVDTLLLNRTSSMLQEKISLKYWLSGSLLYPFFSTSVVILSLFKNYEWKGETFTK